MRGVCGAALLAMAMGSCGVAVSASVAQASNTSVAAAQASSANAAPPLPLAAATGAWVVQISRRGSFGPAQSTIAISSSRDVLCDDQLLQCHPEMYRDAADRVDSILTREDLTTAWSDKRLLTCMDYPSTTITIYRRHAKSVQTVTSYKWTALSRDDLPEAVKALRDTLESLASRKSRLTP